jgi:hypothetical protein
VSRLTRLLIVFWTSHSRQSFTCPQLLEVCMVRGIIRASNGCLAAADWLDSIPYKKLIRRTVLDRCLDKGSSARACIAGLLRG